MNVYKHTHTCFQEHSYKMFCYTYIELFKLRNVSCVLMFKGFQSKLVFCILFLVLFSDSTLQLFLNLQDTDQSKITNITTPSDTINTCPTSDFWMFRDIFHLYEVRLLDSKDFKNS